MNLATSDVPAALNDANGTPVTVLLCWYLSGRVVLVALTLVARWSNTLRMLAVLSRKCSPKELHVAFKESCVGRSLFWPRCDRLFMIVNMQGLLTRLCCGNFVRIVITFCPGQHGTHSPTLCREQIIVNGEFGLFSIACPVSCTLSWLHVCPVCNTLHSVKQ